MGLICGNCKYERPSNHRGADTSCPLCNTAYPTGLAAPAIGGAPLSKATHSQRKKRTIAVVIAILLVVAVVIVKPYFDEYQAETRAKNKKHETIIKGQNAIKGFLVDPNSAEFKIEYVFWSSSTDIVCGSVNSRNRAGGYVGFQRFIWYTPNGEEKVAISGEHIQDGFGISSWDNLCK